MGDVVVVDDSQFMRIQIRDILEQRGHSVVGEAGNGNAAVDAVLDHEPDVVTMDVKMPGMDGIEAVERIMSVRPTPILMLSGYTEDGAETTFEALDAGAVDFFPKPEGEVSPALVQYADDLAESVRVVADADVPARTGTDVAAHTDSGVATSTGSGSAPRAEASTGPTPSAASGPREAAGAATPTVVIAASTGGPPVVESILETLPASAGLRVLVVQHMPEQFTGRFAERLDSLCELQVREARPNDRLGPGEAVIAKAGYHTEVRAENGAELALALTEEPPVHSVRPAADVTLESVADAVSEPVVAVVLSGMGRDGTAGLQQVAEAGGTTIVQAPDDARLPSMPEAAIQADAADDVCPAAGIPDRILEAIRE
jgi:two-component system chemotaxis response regulator CheB